MVKIQTSVEAKNGAAISAKANLQVQVKARRAGRSQNPHLTTGGLA